MIAHIEVTYRPPMPDPVPGMLHDPGGYVYRVRREDRRLRFSGASRGLDVEKAKARAMNAAKGAGFTHYRLQGEGGTAPLPL
jgi:hypothetical protein